MPTNLRSLPQLGLTMVTRTNEAWLDAPQFLAPGDVPISLAGIAFHSILRPTPESRTGYALTSTELSYRDIPAQGQFVIGGTGNSVLAWVVPSSVMSNVPPGDYLLDVIGSAPGEDQRCVIVGTLKVERGIT